MLKRMLRSSSGKRLTFHKVPDPGTIHLISHVREIRVGGHDPFNPGGVGSIYKRRIFSGRRKFYNILSNISRRMAYLDFVYLEQP